MYPHSILRTLITMEELYKCLDKITSASGVALYFNQNQQLVITALRSLQEMNKKFKSSKSNRSLMRLDT